MAFITLAVSSSYASFAANWFTGNGINQPAALGGGPLPAGALVQLIWTPDPIIDPIDPFSPTNTTVNDIVLQNDLTTMNFIFTFNNYFHEGVGPFTGFTEAQMLSGYIYVRVFNVGSPGIGDYYGVSQLEYPLQDQDPFPNIPNLLDISPYEDEPFSNWIQIVPEPSVFALAALGAGVIGIRRIRRS